MKAVQNFPAAFRTAWTTVCVGGLQHAKRKDSLENVSVEREVAIYFPKLELLDLSQCKLSSSICAARRRHDMLFVRVSRNEWSLLGS